MGTVSLNMTLRIHIHMYSSRTPIDLCIYYFFYNISKCSKIHILGSFQNIRIARNAICSLILGKHMSRIIVICCKHVHCSLAITSLLWTCEMKTPLLRCMHGPKGVHCELGYTIILCVFVSYLTIYNTQTS